MELLGRQLRAEMQSERDERAELRRRTEFAEQAALAGAEKVRVAEEMSQRAQETMSVVSQRMEQTDIHVAGLDARLAALGEAVRRVQDDGRSAGAEIEGHDRLFAEIGEPHGALHRAGPGACSNASRTANGHRRKPTPCATASRACASTTRPRSPASTRCRASTSRSRPRFGEFERSLERSRTRSEQQERGLTEIRARLRRPAGAAAARLGTAPGIPGEATPPPDLRPRTGGPRDPRPHPPAGREPRCLTCPAPASRRSRPRPPPLARPPASLPATPPTCP